jgi:MFS family permease
MSTVFQPSFASFSNIFGRKPLIVIAIQFFLVGTIVAGIAKNFTYMLAGRSIQRVGEDGLIALSEIVMTDLVPLRLRGKYFGILSAMWSIGSVTGPSLNSIPPTERLHSGPVLMTIVNHRDGFFTSIFPLSS